MHIRSKNAKSLRAHRYKCNIVFVFSASSCVTFKFFSSMRVNKIKLVVNMLSDR